MWNVRVGDDWVSACRNGGGGRGEMCGVGAGRPGENV